MHGYSHSLKRALLSVSVLIFASMFMGASCGSDDSNVTVEYQSGGFGFGDCSYTTAALVVRSDTERNCSNLPLNPQLSAAFDIQTGLPPQGEVTFDDIPHGRYCLDITCHSNNGQPVRKYIDDIRVDGDERFSVAMSVQPAAINNQCTYVASEEVQLIDLPSFTSFIAEAVLNNCNLSFLGNFLGSPENTELVCGALKSMAQASREFDIDLELECSQGQLGSTVSPSYNCFMNVASINGVPLRTNLRLITGSLTCTSNANDATQCTPISSLEFQLDEFFKAAMNQNLFGNTRSMSQANRDRIVQAVDFLLGDGEMPINPSSISTLAVDQEGRATTLSLNCFNQADTDCGFFEDRMIATCEIGN